LTIRRRHTGDKLFIGQPRIIEQKVTAYGLGEKVPGRTRLSKSSSVKTTERLQRIKTELMTVLVIKFLNETGNVLIS